MGYPLVSSLADVDANDRDDPGQRRAGADELDRELGCDFEPARVHVILDHHLQAELRMPERDDDERDHPSRGERMAQHLARMCVVARVHEREDEADDPNRQQHERHAGHALDDEMMRAALCAAEPGHVLERRAQVAAVHAGSAHAAPPCAITQAQTRPVSTRLATITAMPLRYAWAMPKP